MPWIDSLNLSASTRPFLSALWAFSTSLRKTDQTPLAMVPTAVRARPIPAIGPPMEAMPLSFALTPPSSPPRPDAARPVCWMASLCFLASSVAALVAADILLTLFDPFSPAFFAPSWTSRSFFLTSSSSAWVFLSAASVFARSNSSCTVLLIRRSKRLGFYVQTLQKSLYEKSQQRAS